MRALAMVLLAALALSGCASSDDGTDGTTSTSETDTTTTTQGGGGGGGGGGGVGGTTTTPSGPSGNSPPTASLQASVAAGGVPLNVTFTLDGSDPDEDALTWTLDVTGDGTSDQNGSTLPATVPHTYTTEGLVTVTLTVSDGKSSRQSNVTVNVTTDAAAKATYVISNSFVGIDPSALAPVRACSATSPQDIGGNWNLYDVDLTGWSYKIEPAGKGFVAQFATADAYVGSPMGETGTVPEGGVSEVHVCTADPQSGGAYTFTATAP